MRHSKVLPESTLRRVVLFAVLALVHARFTVCIHVHLQRGLPFEGLLADRTAKNVRSVMRGHVPDHVSLLREAQTTDFALERLLIRVGTQMQPHLRAARELLVALWTRVSLFRVVLLRLVQFHLTLVREPLLADVAREGLWLFRTLCLVTLETGGGLVLVVALWAHVDL